MNFLSLGKDNFEIGAVFEAKSINFIKNNGIYAKICQIHRDL